MNKLKQIFLLVNINLIFFASKLQTQNISLTLLLKHVDAIRKNSNYRNTIIFTKERFFFTL